MFCNLWKPEKDTDYSDFGKFLGGFLEEDGKVGPRSDSWRRKYRRFLEKQ